MFAPYSLIRLEPCLNQASGKILRELYLATFPDFEAIYCAMRFWNAEEMQQNPFMAMVMLLDIEEDKTIARHLSPLQKLDAVAVPEQLLQVPSYQPKNLFEEWWAATDSDNWDERRHRIEHAALLPHFGASLLFRFPVLLVPDACEFGIPILSSEGRG
jgi:hypothetical protein